MPSELSLEEIRNYLLENGGTARNHDLVKHFRRFLTDPETRGGLNFLRDTRVRDCLAVRRDLAFAYGCKHGMTARNASYRGIQLDEAYDFALQSKRGIGSRNMSIPWPP